MRYVAQLFVGVRLLAEINSFHKERYCEEGSKSTGRQSAVGVRWHALGSGRAEARTLPIETIAHRGRVTIRRDFSIANESVTRDQMRSRDKIADPTDCRPSPIGGRVRASVRPEPRTELSPTERMKVSFALPL